jgi:hypothetical protein
MDIHAHKPSNELPTAATNVWRVRNDIDDLLYKLMQPYSAGLHLSYFKKLIPKLNKESKEKYYSRVHLTGQQLIRNLLHLDSQSAVNYEVVKIKEEFYFFYVSSVPTELNSTIRKLLAETVDKRSLAQGLLSLNLKLDILEQASKDYEIDPVHYNSSIYVSTDIYTRQNGKRALIDTFEIKLFYSAYNEIITTLHARTYIGDIDTFLQTPLEDTVLFFNDKGALYKSLEVLDARIYSKKKFMRFQSKYYGCQNHAHFLINRSLRRVMEKLDIDYEPVNFKASVVLDEFLTISSKVLVNKVVVVDNYGDFPSPGVQEFCYEQLKHAFPGCEIIHVSQIGSYENLSEDNNYLVLNRSMKNNGSSIVDKGADKLFNSFWQALDWYNRGNFASLDLYSRLKIENFRLGQKLILQGIDLPPAISTSSDHVINQNIITKVAIELWIKECIFRYKRIVGLPDLPDSSCQLIYVRKPEGKFYASVVNCKIANNTIQIDGVSRYSNEDELRFNCLQLRFLEKLYDGSFYLYDVINEVLLCAYTNIRTPQILGNIAFDNIDRFKENGDSLRKLSASAENPLPYYVNPKTLGQYHHIFLQQDGVELKYFVSPKGNPRSEFDKQSRTYNLLTWDKNGSLIPQLEQKVTDLFFRTFTDDILLNNQVSKSSLLTKVSRIYLEN